MSRRGQEVLPAESAEARVERRVDDGKQRPARSDMH